MVDAKPVRWGQLTAYVAVILLCSCVVVFMAQDNSPLEDASNIALRGDNDDDVNDPIDLMQKYASQLEKLKAAGKSQKSSAHKAHVAKAQKAKAAANIQRKKAATKRKRMTVDEVKKSDASTLLKQSSVVAIVASSILAVVAIL